jgi:sugar/nucleoside kinase (ribokinase family)
MWTISLPPTLPFAIVNPIGAGDAVASGMFHELTDRLRLPQDFDNPSIPTETDDTADERVLLALAWGVAVGAASCAGSLCSIFDIEVARNLYKSIKIESVDR